MLSVNFFCNDSGPDPDPLRSCSGMGSRIRIRLKNPGFDLDGAN